MSTRTPVIAIVSDAGSAGKTTSAVSLAAVAAEQGLQVLLVDLDPQANATRWVGVDPSTVEVNSGAVLLRQATLAEAVVDTAVPGLRLLPATEDLQHQRIELGRATMAEQRLRRALDGVEADLVIIDCQAGVAELLPVTAMVAATHVVTVTLPGAKELEGLPRVEGMVEEVREAGNDDLRLVGIIPCAVPSANRGALFGAALQMLRQVYADLVTPAVRYSVTALGSYDARLPLPLFAAKAPVTEDYRTVWEHLVQAGVTR